MKENKPVLGKVKEARELLELHGHPSNIPSGRKPPPPHTCYENDGLLNDVMVGFVGAYVSGRIICGLVLECVRISWFATKCRTYLLFELKEYHTCKEEL
jgi:hypothetical protein